MSSGKPMRAKRTLHRVVRRVRSFNGSMCLRSGHYFRFVVVTTAVMFFPAVFAVALVASVRAGARVLWNEVGAMIYGVAHAWSRSRDIDDYVRTGKKSKWLCDSFPSNAGNEGRKPAPERQA